MTDRKFANTLSRGLSVLRVFRISDDGLTHSELVSRTGLAPATVTRLSYTLCELGYLTQSRGVFRLGPACLALASVAYAGTSFLDLARAPMQDLAARTGTLTLMAVGDDRAMSLVNTWRPQGVASVWLEVGNRVPVAGSSTGTAYLAALSEDKFEAMEPDADLRKQRQTGLEQLKSYGFTFLPSGSRFSANVHAVARPYLASKIGAPVVFGAGAMPEVLSDQRILEEVGPALRDVVLELEQATGISLDLNGPGRRG